MKFHEKLSINSPGIIKCMQADISCLEVWLGYIRLGYFGFGLERLG
jgi:hypothetical protein